MFQLILKLKTNLCGGRSVVLFFPITECESDYKWKNGLSHSQNLSSLIKVNEVDLPYSQINFKENTSNFIPCMQQIFCLFNQEIGQRIIWKLVNEFLDIQTHLQILWIHFYEIHLQEQPHGLVLAFCILNWILTNRIYIHVKIFRARKLEIFQNCCNFQKSFFNHHQTKPIEFISVSVFIIVVWW